MLRISSHKDISGMNTFRMKAKAERFVKWSSPADLAGIDFSILPAPILPVGEGSNLLFTGDFPGTVVFSTFKDKEVLEEMCAGDDVFVRCGAGLVWDDFCDWTARCGWWGAENLSAIPGTVGAAPVQNVGAYGVEAGDIIHEVSCYDILEGRFVSFSAAECRFAYRDSFFKHCRGRYIVCSVIFHLYKDFRPRLEYGHLAAEVERNAEICAVNSDPYKVTYDTSSIAASPVTPLLVRNTVKAIRESKLPAVKKVGSAGSFFKNPVVKQAVYEKVCSVVQASRGADAAVPHYDLPDNMVKIPAAFLIDFCGLKGASFGGAAVWKDQPLVIVNASGKATPADILGLENLIKDTVRSAFGISLEAEVDHIVSVSRL